VDKKTFFKNLVDALMDDEAIPLSLSLVDAEIATQESSSFRET